MEADQAPPEASGTAVPGTWRDADAETRRRWIVEAALARLAAHGPEGVTMRHVAADLGVGTMTLYTYVDGRRGLRRAMVREGFRRLDEACDAASTLGTASGWRGGARAYLRFALENPNLYKLMFDAPVGAEDTDLLEGGFEPLFAKVRARLSADDPAPEPEREARRRAGRFWIGLHGLAMLAIAGRLSVLEGDLDAILDDLLEGLAPT